MKNFTKKILPVLLLLMSCNLLAQLPKLNSLPAATATMFLDFDGQTVNSYAWNNGSRLICAASGMSSAQVTEIFQRVSEDYRPFNINITTDSTKFLSAPVNRRIRMIVTPTSAWYPGVGGVSYIGSFTWGDDTPGFIFTDRLLNFPKYIAECCSHEGGHTVGLSHQSSWDNNCNLTDQYSQGTGIGEIGWAPVMGNSYYRNMTGWNDGPTPYGCSNTQDNLTIITTTNGFGYRPDDFTDSLNASAYNAGTDNFSIDGLITTTTDNDAFQFSVSHTGPFHLEAKPFGINNSDTAANLDIKLLLYNSSKVLLGSYNPSAMLNVIHDTILNAGSYYLILSGTGNENTSEYGSLGSYNLRGTAGVLAINNVSLSGNSSGSIHNFNWKIISDDPIKSQVLEMSTDGIHFNILTEVNSITKAYSYNVSQNGNLYYRLKVVSVLNQTVYSNTVALKSNGNLSPAFSVSNFVKRQVEITGSENFKYILVDVNGKRLSAGGGQPGKNIIDVTGLPGGMYIIQIISNNNKQTERIIKQ